MTQTVLITGASRGIGLEFATQYAKDKWKVLACCRNPEKANDLNALAKKQANVSILPLDVCKQEDIERLSNDLSSSSIDLLINNAGVSGTLDGN